MGEVKVFVELENLNDLDNKLSKDQIRRYGVEALVDTGAAMLILPQDVVELLGIPLRRTAIVTYANEFKEERSIAGPVFVTIKGRTMIAECIVGPPASEALVGQIILETMDFIVDCPRQSLTTRPESPIYPLLKVKSIK